MLTKAVSVRRLRRPVLASLSGYCCRSVASVTLAEISWGVAELVCYWTMVSVKEPFCISLGMKAAHLNIRATKRKKHQF